MTTIAKGRGERIQLRATVEQKDLLNRAAEAAHEDLTTFVLTSASARAEDLLGAESKIVLSPEAAERLLDALERPAEMNDALAAALARPRRFVWV